MLWAGFRSLRAREPLHAMTNVALSFCFFLFGALFLLGALALRGYHTFNYEEYAATVTITPVAEQKFNATFTYPDGSKHQYELMGDELYVDAKVLKFKPIANLLGFHTSYQLSRVGGRYHELQDETSKNRTIFALSEENMVDLFKLRSKHASLAVFVDAKYGSASFVPAKETQYMLMVSTSGLLFRELQAR